MYGSAVTPCPPPPPPLPVTQACPVPVTITSGSMYPGCYENNCPFWGYTKALDNIETGLRSMAHTSFGTNPYIQFDLGTAQSTLDAVVMMVRADCCLERSTNLNLYLSNTSDITTVVPFATRVSASALGQTLTVAVPDGLSGRYLTILRNGSDTSINLYEVKVLANGE
jgi:hypothetical protein